MRQRDWLLLLLDGGIDPIRVQKGMFLFAMESGAPEAETYQFVPYNWGPFSKRIYGDLEWLQAKGLVERVSVANASYARYRRTAEGNAIAERLAARANQEQLGSLLRLREKVTKTSFDGLLRAVYRKYPEYASKSIFNQ